MPVDPLHVRLDKNARSVFAHVSSELMLMYTPATALSLARPGPGRIWNSGVSRAMNRRPCVSGSPAIHYIMFMHDRLVMDNTLKVLHAGRSHNMVMNYY